MIQRSLEVSIRSERDSLFGAAAGEPFGGSSYSPFTQRRAAWCIALSLAPLAAVVFGVVEFLAEPPAIPLSGVLVFFLLACCAYTDFRWQIIPNWATYSAFVWAVVISAAGALASSGAVSEPAHYRVFFPMTAGSIGIGDCLGGALVCFLVMLMIHSATGGGAGDVKLATAIGALLGIKLGILAICYTFLLAGIVSLAVSIWIMGPISIMKMFGRWLGSFFLPLWIEKPSSEETGVLKRSLPLGIFFALGTLLAVLDLQEFAR